ncbi:MAG: GNAT family N-acetyltransferase [Nitrospinota bacterium]|jgi:RimJ/RimL family protein N-acetyltransferase|nr:GNAT family N-acetyltransferase [Nitrospinota bacterium]MDP6483902.1 GNAT family N-acetyltransferase [Nitrospinota bacterium]MDP6618537.1 GNAT family N-acetyltransferase [Nitrospinota bacterium]HJM44185.1 GNAT family N-acetyltransferase [Nitrospinota bacterium]
MCAEPEKSVVETERLLLRPLAPGDLEDFAVVFSDPEVTRYLGYDTGDYGRSVRELEFWIDARERRGPACRGSCTRPTGG